jgi:protein gp37
MDIDFEEFYQIDSLTGRNTDMGRPCKDVNHIDLLIAGAETGPGARLAELDWLRSARDQCASAGVPFFLKQVNSKGDRELDGRRHGEWI